MVKESIKTIFTPNGETYSIKHIIEQSDLVKQYAYKDKPIIAFYTDNMDFIQCQIVVSPDIMDDKTSSFNKLCDELKNKHELDTAYISNNCGSNNKIVSLTFISKYNKYH